MKNLNKILTSAAGVMLAITAVLQLMRGEWLMAILLVALLVDGWIIYKDGEVIKKLHRIAEEQCNELARIYPKLSMAQKEKESTIKLLAESDRENNLLRKDLAEAKKREEIAHKTIEDQRQENYDLMINVTALENQMAALDAQNKILAYKLSRKPNRENPTNTNTVE